ncbi:ABC transporter permease [Sedimentibacter sp. zth1]|uniref:ABC transporter permease n=1 Tax=Sedimentibacter sp. zth1 TaxID=2816908 RepID=UPI001A90FFAB|nr:ABC transporter permease [Sedimentibacter sp. zth1]QSX07057.1 ABC transporter permease [Sedimentibacter sp. zth1]
MKNKSKYYAYPYIVWIIMFILLPVFLVFLYSFTKKNVGGTANISFTLENYKLFLNTMYIRILLKSLLLAAVSTILCLLIGYPAAYLISKAPISRKSTMLFLCVVPMWMNMLLRTYAWMTILGNNGIINHFLINIGLPKLSLLYNDFAVVLGMVYNFLPFMILPIYTVLSKLDNSLIQAAEDLGANSRTTFKKVIFPLSMPGVITGIVMVFMPAVSTFIIPRLLGGQKDFFIGSLIENLFSVGSNWNFGSAVSIIMMIIILISMSIMNKFDVDKEGGAGLW